MASALDQLKKYSVIVADTGDISQFQSYQPQDATTNPTLLYQAVQLPAYAHLLDSAIAYGRGLGCKDEQLIEEICDKLAISIGKEIINVIPGVVSTEVDACLSFNTHATVDKAKKLISMYEQSGIPKDRILIKIASTWEGCQAAKILEACGIHCNMTLLFSMVQAIAAAEAGSTLISPFVGRILDWHKKNDPTLTITSGADDPGVRSVAQIYSYYKAHGYKTIVMGASFRNTSEILALSGCDKLTVSPALLQQLSNDTTSTVNQCLPDDQNVKPGKTVAPLTEQQFRWMLNEDPMATEKLSEGIRNFNKDLNKLKDFIRNRLAAIPPV